MTNWKKEIDRRDDVIVLLSQKSSKVFELCFVIIEFSKYIKSILHVFQINKTLIKNKENFQLRKGKI